MKNHRFSRRALLQGTAALAGGVAASKLGGTSLFSSTAVAAEAAEKSAVLCVFLQGGYNAVFSSADSFRAAQTFGVTGDNILQSVGNGLVVDKATLGTLSPFALGHMATAGVLHGQSAHDVAQSLMVGDGTRTYYLKLAQAMGGDAAIKAANLGPGLPAGPRPEEGDVSLQQINDMAATIAALGGSDPLNLNRDITAAAMTGSQSMSSQLVAASPKLLTSFREGMAAGIETLKKPVLSFDVNEFNTAYGLTGTAINDFKSKLAGAELMIRAGANVVYAEDLGQRDTTITNGWDSHGDRTAANVRTQMNARILPGLKTFISRMLEGPGAAGRNVTIVIMGDFARSLPGSDHARCVAATVIGKYVKVGTTGKVSADVQLPSAPGPMGLWSLLAALAKLPASNPLGANQHPSLVL